MFEENDMRSEYSDYEEFDAAELEQPYADMTAAGLDEAGGLPDREPADDVMTATVRTTVPAAWSLLIVMALNSVLDLELTVDDLLPFLPAFAVVAAVFYRLGRVVEARFPKVGYVLFGSTRTPSY